MTLFDTVLVGGHLVDPAQGLEGHYYPSLYRPDCIDVDATVKSALANADLVKGFKAHAEVGGAQAVSSRIRSPAIPAASSTAKARCIRWCARRSTRG